MKADEVRRIQSRFIAPCCWHENLSVHDSPIAAQLRAEVESLAARGESDRQIVDRFVSQYGERILAEPRGWPLLILTLTPILVLFITLAFLIAYLRRRPHRIPSPPGSRLSAGNRSRMTRLLIAAVFLLGLSWELRIA
jgi:cytochrome c-type biogenesis protein CcmH/NrfF